MEEYICDRCGGVGALPNTIGDSCNRCLGTGKLNWIENVFGKEKPINYFDFSDLGTPISDILEECKNEIIKNIGVPEQYLFPTVTGKSLFDFAKVLGIPKRNLINKSEQTIKNEMVERIKNG